MVKTNTLKLVILWKKLLLYNSVSYQVRQIAYD